MPELETTCRVEIECIDNSEKIVYGDTFKVDVKSMDYIIIPFPLTPFALGKKSSFNCKYLIFIVWSKKFSNVNVLQSKMPKRRLEWFKAVH